MLPNLITIGAMKCGTTSLHYYLSHHPEIRMTKRKELDFFIEEGNWKRGLELYEAQFAEPAKVVGESSPNYSKCTQFRGSAEKMGRIVPGAKLIYMVRDPFERTVLHYVHRVAGRRERRPFAVAAKGFSNDYVNASRYYFQIEQFLRFYPPERILVISLDDLSRRRAETLREVFAFLGVDPDFTHENFGDVHHKSSEKKRQTFLGVKLADRPRLRRVIWPRAPWLFERPVVRPTVDESWRRAFYDELRPDIEKLRAFTGKPFPGWGV